MNTNLIHADTFFFISTILLSILAVIFIVAILYIIKILKEVRPIAALARRETEKLAGDLDVARAKIHSAGFTPHAIMSLATGFLTRKKRNAKK